MISFTTPIMRAVGFAALTLSALAADAAAQVSASITFAPGTRLQADHEFGSLEDVVLSPDGHVYIADDLNTEIVKLSADGSLLWRVGRKGSGPGEYRHPYQIAARGTQGVAVLDWGSGRVTLLSGSGRVDATFTLPFPFTQIDGFEVLSDGRFIIAGMTAGAPASKGTVHVFSDSLRYQHSFGPWAEAEDSVVVLYTGSGGISTDEAGRVLLTRKRPYEIQFFDISGRRLGSTGEVAPVNLGLGDLIEIKQFNNQSFRGITPRSKDVQLPVAAVSLGERGFLAGRATFSSTTIDLISRTGALVDSAGTADCDRILAVDVTRSLLYCMARRDDVPTLMRVPYTVAGRRRR